jgi:glycerol kinase
MQYVLAIDQGTTSTRAILFDNGSRIIGIDQREHDQLTPRPGWVEHDALQILARTESVITGVLTQANVSLDRLAAVGIANQRETTVLWERRTGRPIAPAIVWQDNRTEPLCHRLSENGGTDRWRERTGLPISTYFSATKIAWILDQVPGARAQARAGELLFGTIDTWLAWNLTGEHVTDVTNASRTLLMNLHTLNWDDEILEALHIPRAILPRIVSSSGVVAPGRGVLDSVPVCGILGDQQAALFGQGCFLPGETKCTYGTGCFLLMNTGNAVHRSSKGLLSTVAYRLGEQAPTYAVEGSVAIAGAAVQWLRDNLGLIRKSADIEALAQGVPDNAGVYFVPAFTGLLAPHWRPDARGTIVGLTRFTERGHLARATLEATAYQTEELLQAMRSDSGLSLRHLQVDGGMVENDLLMQFQADISDVTVVRSSIVETTALGAAYAAGLAVGYWTSIEELHVQLKATKEFSPRMSPGNRARLMCGWQRALEKSLGQT